MIANPLARAALEDHAADLERQARWVAAQIAALVVANDAPSEPAVPALRPPARKPLSGRVARAAPARKRRR